MSLGLDSLFDDKQKKKSHFPCSPEKEKRERAERPERVDGFWLAHEQQAHFSVRRFSWQKRVTIFSLASANATIYPFFVPLMVYAGGSSVRYFPAYCKQYNKKVLGLFLQM